MAEMKRLIAVAAMVAGAAFPVYAQRGASVGHGGGFSGRGSSVDPAVHNAPMFRGSIPSFHGSAPAIARGPYMGSPQLYNRYPIASPNHLMSTHGPVAYRGHAGEPDHRYGYRGSDHYRRAYFGAYAVGFPSGFTIWPGSLLDSGLYDSSYYDHSGDAGPAYDANQPPADYAPQAPPAADYVPPQAPVEQAEAAPGPYRPEYQRPLPSPEPEEAVTLIFKDGRPSEQIHNYMLTRKTLYVQDDTRREIPVEDLDIPATQKANKAAGVDFQLPGSAR